MAASRSSRGAGRAASYRNPALFMSFGPVTRRIRALQADLLSLTMAPTGACPRGSPRRWPCSRKTSSACTRSSRPPRRTYRARSSSTASRRTARRNGAIDTHRTLIKAAPHCASGGCACRLHRDAAPASSFQRRTTFCGLTFKTRWFNTSLIIKAVTFNLGPLTNTADGTLFLKSVFSLKPWLELYTWMENLPPAQSLRVDLRRTCLDG